MILKFKAKTLKKKSNLTRNLLILYFIITSSIATLFLVFFFSSYTVKIKSYQFLDLLSKAGRIEYIHIFEIGWKALQSKFMNFDKIELEISFKDIVKLEKDRALAINRGTLGINDNLTEVNVKITHQNKKLNARIRLKGGRDMHWKNKSTSSYNFYLKSNEYLMGMRTFTIHKPGVRNYIHEWIFHEMMGDMGLIKSNYHFFHLYINGENQGLYALEEKMSKEIIERNKRRNGPIFTAVNFISNKEKDIPALKIYQDKYWSRPENIELAKTATNKFADFLSGRRGIENTFDLEKMAAYFAIMDATYTLHAIPFNSKLYYNPINGLFEPVPRDGHRSLPNYHEFNKNFYNGLIIDSLDQPETMDTHGINLQIHKGRWYWVNKFFMKDGKINKKFYSLYLKYINKISKKEYYENFLKKRKDEIYNINANIYGDISFYATTRDYGTGIYYFSEKDLKYRFDYIQKRLETVDKSFFVRLRDKFKLEVRVAYPFYNDPNNRETKLSYIIVDKIICNNSNEILIKKQLEIHTNTFIDLSKKNFNENNCNIVHFTDHIINKKYIVKIDELNNFFKFKELKDKKNKNYLNYFSKKNNKLFLKENETRIGQNIYIPQNLVISMGPGQKLILFNNAFILSDSPWNADGDKDQISITGLENNFGGGILINNSKLRSYFKNVKFSYLAGYKKDFLDKTSNKRYGFKTYYSKNIINDYREITIEKNLDSANSEFIILGSLNFHQSNAELVNVAFEKISSEDALNIVNSKFKIKNISFNNNASDSIDFDFSNGKIEKAKFINIGNDAIDFSGSKATIKDMVFENINDKLISVGENSNVKISNINANNSYAGIASKDGSIVKAENITMENVELPFLSYNKKFEYNIAQLHIKNINIKNFKNKWVTDQNSKIFHNGSSTGNILNDILPLVYKKDIKLLETKSAK
jgi:hypothetical protein